MSLDFPAILAVVVSVSVAILAVDTFVFRPRRRAGGHVINGTAGPPPWFVEQARAVIPVVVIVLLFRSFVFEPFRIPSASMMPGLVDGDFILVSKYSYGLRLPIINTKILSIGDPKRGDVVVFRLPRDPSVYYIKRLIGLPGDHIVVRENQVIVNGKPAPTKPTGVYDGGYGFNGAGLATEQLDGRHHVVMLAQNRFATDFDAVVPAGHYFFMGDNRNDSEDSRFADVGFVPQENVVGRATMIWLNLSGHEWPHWRRIGARLD